MDLDSGDVWRQQPGGAAEPVDLPPQAARFLTLLVGSPGALVERHELRRALWGDRWVDWEAALHQVVRRARLALDDGREPRRYIQTVARRGYRFVAPVEACPTESPSRPGRAWSAALRAALVAGALLAVIATWGFLERRSTAAPSADDTVLEVTGEARRLHAEAVHLLSRGRVDQALRRLAAAGELAPRWSAPWSAIAEVRLASARSDRVELARAAAETALARDPRDARAWRVLAQLRMWEAWDWLGARAALERAIELDPENADGWQLLAALETVAGREPAAVEAAGRALELEPVSTARRADLGWTHYYFGRVDQAIAECGRGLELDPASVSARQCVEQAQLLAARERGEPLPGAALSELTRLVEELAERTACTGGAVMAVPRLLAGDRGGALDALARGVERGSGWDLPFALVDPLLAPLASAPELAEARAALGLPI